MTIETEVDTEVAKITPSMQRELNRLRKELNYWRNTVSLAEAHIFSRVTLINELKRAAYKHGVKFER